MCKFRCLFLGLEAADSIFFRGCRGHDRMIVGYTTTYAISAYHHLTF